MNNKERKAFWNTLISFKGEDLLKEATLLNQTIRYPKKLYRFRKIDSYSLEALRTNQLYFSSADHYDDPFDSYCYIDWDNVMDSIISELNDTSKKNEMFAKIHNLFGWSIEQMSIFLNSHSNEEWKEFGKIVIKQTIQEIQKRQWSLCFSESELNETLWLKYADNHRGFVLAFDISMEALLINNQPHKPTGLINNQYYPLYPIYYTNKIYDATSYARYIALDIALSQIPPIIRQSLIGMSPALYWQRERICFVKHKCHEYDKEWRILNPYDIRYHNYMIWKPSGVIIGLRTDEATRKLIIALSKEAGIPHTYECYINNKNRLAKREIKE